MNFEDLQKNWQSQPVNALTDTTLLKKDLQSKWQKHQRKLMLTNIFLTLSFIVVFAVVGWVYFAYRSDFGWQFSASIGTMYLLLIIYLMVSWRGYAFKKEYLDVSSTDYINYQLLKLSWQRKTITTWSLVYAVLLWLIIMMYELEVTARGTLMFKATTIAITSAYIFGTTIWSRFTKQKKQLAKLDEMIAELNNINKAFN